MIERIKRGERREERGERRECQRSASKEVKIVMMSVIIEITFLVYEELQHSWCHLPLTSLNISHLADRVFFVNKFPGGHSSQGRGWNKY